MLLLSTRSLLNRSRTSIPLKYFNFFSPELPELDTVLYTCTVKEEVLRFENFKLKYPACHVILLRFNSIGSQALQNQSKCLIRQFLPNLE